YHPGLEPGNRRHARRRPAAPGDPAGAGVREPEPGPVADPAERDAGLRRPAEQRAIVAGDERARLKGSRYIGIKTRDVAPRPDSYGDPSRPSQAMPALRG